MRRLIVPFSLKKPLVVYLLIVIVTAFFAAQLTRIHVDTDPENMLQPDQPDRLFHNRVKKRFNMHDAIVVGVVNKINPNGIYNVDSLSNLHALSAGILQIEGVVTSDLISLATSDNITQGDNGEIRFSWLLKDPPTSEAEALKLRSYVERLPLVMNTLVSEDARAVAIYVPIKSKDLSYPISLKIQTLTQELKGNDSYYITGLPIAEDTFGVEMFSQMGLSAPLAGLMIFLLMYYFFRNMRLILAPMIVAMVTVIVSMGLLVSLGFTVHIMSSMIPIFLMPIAVVDSVHIMSEFSDSYVSETDASECIKRVVEHLYRPMLFTSVTTSIGFASLLLTPIPPVQVFGFFVAFGVLLAFLVTILFIPAYIARMKPKQLASLLTRVKSDGEGGSLLASGLRRIGHLAFSRGGSIIVLSIVVLAISVMGVVQIKINDNPVLWFKDTHRIRIADQVLNEHFAGTYDAFLVFDYDAESVVSPFRKAASLILEKSVQSGMDMGQLKKLVDQDVDDVAMYFDSIIAEADEILFASDPSSSDEGLAALEGLITLSEDTQVASKYFQSPEALRFIETMQQVLMDSGGVGKTNSIADVVKVVNRELFDGNSDAYRLPDSSPAVAQTLLQFQSSHRPQDLWHMVTSDFVSTSIWLQLKSGDNEDMTQVMNFVDTYFEAHPLPVDVSARWAGKTYINVVWQNDMVTGMLKSLLGAFVAVFLIMALLFRSALFGLLAMIPLTVTILAVYGMIGWIGKDYDMPIALLSSLTLGLSVDFAIHFIQRMRTLVEELGSFEAASRQMFEEPARAISRNAVVIALGFTPLFFAELVPYITVGAFMAAIMAISALATLLLIPALMTLGRRWLFPSDGHGPAVLETDVRNTGVSQ